jgi:hypothetical protein
MSTSRNTRLRSLRWPLAVMLLAVLACTAPMAAPTASPTAPVKDAYRAEPESDTIRLEVINDLSDDICTLYLSPAGDTKWGESWLPDGETVPAGESRALDIPPGHYDLAAEGCDQEWLGEAREVDLTADSTYTFSTPEVPEPAGVLIWIFDVCPHPVITPEDEVLLRVGWNAKTAELAESNADEISMVVSVDGQELEGVQAIRHPVLVKPTADEVGCQFKEVEALAYWDLPLGRLEAGRYTISVEYFVGVQISDGFDTYPAGSLGTAERTITVGGEGAGEQPEEERVALTLVNDSSVDICSVWIGLPASDWDGDLLDAENITLHSGEEYVVWIVPGVWALRADGCDGSQVAFEEAYDVTEATTWHIEGSVEEEKPFCGNGFCEPGESYDDCPLDCNPPATSGRCGDGRCDASETVDSGNFCPYDCGWCGDGYCTDPELFNGTCPADCD